MRKYLSCTLIALAIILNGCDSSTDDKLPDESYQIISTPFTEGIVEMGIFSNEVDLGKLIGKIDFSRPDVKKQYEDLIQQDAEVKSIVEVINNIGNLNPMAAFAITMNIAECTYYVKNDIVLGKVQGFGWTMDNYHNKSQDIASLYLETIVQTDKIVEHDRKVYSSYNPSENAGVGAVNNIDFDQYNRAITKPKHNVLGYECDVIVYTPKTIDENAPIQLQKLVVYTSPLFSNTINFTHPFYLEENGGILQIDIYYSNSETPTLVMKPKKIKKQELSDQALISRISTPVYSTDDINWGFKSLAIMMSGWGVLED